MYTGTFTNTIFIFSKVDKLIYMYELVYQKFKLLIIYTLFVEGLTHLLL